jgi:tetratricopeptide (TPR) repeat protein
MVQESNKLRRILFQTRPTAYTHRGGDTTLLERYSKILIGRGFDVMVDTEGTLDPAAFDIVHLFNFAIPQLLEEQGRNIVASGRPYVVTTLAEDISRFHSQSQAYAQGLIKYVASGQEPQQWIAQQPSFTNVKPVTDFNNAWTVEHASALLVNGGRERTLVERIYGKVKNIRVVPVGFDMPLGVHSTLFEKEYGVKDFILCVARIESRKNQLMLLKSLEHADLPVVLIGGGFSYQPDYEKAVRSFKRRGSTLILGRLSDEMLASAYAAARVHVLPSWCELPGLVSLEAAWHGRNVVTCDNGTVRDYLGEHAYYCDPSDEHSILQVTLAAYYTPPKRDARLAVEMYTWAKSVDTLVDVYREAVESYVPSKVSPAIGSSEVSDLNEMTEVENLIEEGEEAAYRGEFTTAHNFIDKVLLLAPDNVRAVRAQGAVFFAEGKVAEARQWFEKACALKRNDPKSLSGLGMCYAREKGYATAHSLFVKSLLVDPVHVVTLAQLVEVSYCLGWFDELAEALARYLKERPDDLQMKFCLAGAQFKLGDLATTTSLVQEILRIDPHHKGTLELEQLLLKATADSSPSRESRPELIDVQDVQLEASPLHSELEKRELPSGGTSHALSNSAGSFVDSSIQSSRLERSETFDKTDERLVQLEDEKRKRNLRKVIDSCQEILSDPGITFGQRQHAKVLLAETYILEGRVDEASEIYSSVLLDDPSSARALCGKGALSANGGKWEEAESLFHQAYACEPSYDVSLAGLGLCAHRRGEHSIAWDWYLKALERNPENTRALLGVVELGYSLNRLPDVERVIKVYLEHHPADLDFLYSLAGCYYAQQKFEQAREEIERITLFDPGHERARELEAMVANKLREQTRSATA